MSHHAIDYEMDDDDFSAKYSQQKERTLSNKSDDRSHRDSASKDVLPPTRISGVRPGEKILVTDPFKLVKVASNPLAEQAKQVVEVMEKQKQTKKETVQINESSEFDWEQNLTSWKNRRKSNPYQPKVLDITSGTIDLDDTQVNGARKSKTYTQLMEERGKRSSPMFTYEDDSPAADTPTFRKPETKNFETRPESPDVTGRTASPASATRSIAQPPTAAESLGVYRSERAASPAAAEIRSSLVNRPSSASESVGVTRSDRSASPAAESRLLSSASGTASREDRFKTPHPIEPVREPRIKPEYRSSSPLESGRKETVSRVPDASVKPSRTPYGVTLRENVMRTSTGERPSSCIITRPTTKLDEPTHNSSRLLDRKPTDGSTERLNSSASPRFEPTTFAKNERRSKSNWELNNLSADKPSSLATAANTPAPAPVEPNNKRAAASIQSNFKNILNKFQSMETSEPPSAARSTKFEHPKYKEFMGSQEFEQKKVQEPRTLAGGVEIRRGGEKRLESDPKKRMSLDPKMFESTYHPRTSSVFDDKSSKPMFTQDPDKHKTWIETDKPKFSQDTGRAKYKDDLVKPRFTQDVSDSRFSRETWKATSGESLDNGISTARPEKPRFTQEDEGSKRAGTISETLPTIETAEQKFANDTVVITFGTPPVNRKEEEPPVNRKKEEEPETGIEKRRRGTGSEGLSNLNDGRLTSQTGRDVNLNDQRLKRQTGTDVNRNVSDWTSRSTTFDDIQNGNRIDYSGNEKSLQGRTTSEDNFRNSDINSRYKPEVVYEPEEHDHTPYMSNVSISVHNGNTFVPDRRPSRELFLLKREDLIGRETEPEATKDLNIERRGHRAYGEKADTSDSRTKHTEVIDDQNRFVELRPEVEINQFRPHDGDSKNDLTGITKSLPKSDLEELIILPMSSEYSTRDERPRGLESRTAEKETKRGSSISETFSKHSAFRARTRFTDPDETETPSAVYCTTPKQQIHTDVEPFVKPNESPILTFEEVHPMAFTKIETKIVNAASVIKIEPSRDIVVPPQTMRKEVDSLSNVDSEIRKMNTGEDRTKLDQHRDESEHDYETKPGQHRDEIKHEDRMKLGQHRDENKHEDGMKLGQHRDENKHEDGTKLGQHIDEPEKMQETIHGIRARHGDNEMPKRYDTRVMENKDVDSEETETKTTILNKSHQFSEVDMGEMAKDTKLFKDGRHEDSKVFKDERHRDPKDEKRDDSKVFKDDTHENETFQASQTKASKDERYDDATAVKEKRRQDIMAIVDRKYHDTKVVRDERHDQDTKIFKDERYQDSSVSKDGRRPDILDAGDEKRRDVRPSKQEEEIVSIKLEDKVVDFISFDDPQQRKPGELEKGEKLDAGRVAEIGLKEDSTDGTDAKQGWKTKKETVVSIDARMPSAAESRPAVPATAPPPAAEAAAEPSGTGSTKTPESFSGKRNFLEGVLFKTEKPPRASPVTAPDDDDPAPSSSEQIADPGAELEPVKTPQSFSDKKFLIGETLGLGGSPKPPSTKPPPPAPPPKTKPKPKPPAPTNIPMTNGTAPKQGEGAKHGVLADDDLNFLPATQLLDVTATKDKCRLVGMSNRRPPIAAANRRPPTKVKSSNLDIVDNSPRTTNPSTESNLLIFGDSPNPPRSGFDEVVHTRSFAEGARVHTSPSRDQTVATGSQCTTDSTNLRLNTSDQPARIPRPSKEGPAPMVPQSFDDEEDDTDEDDHELVQGRLSSDGKPMSSVVDAADADNDNLLLDFSSDAPPPLPSAPPPVPNWDSFPCPVESTSDNLINFDDNTPNDKIEIIPGSIRVFPDEPITLTLETSRPTNVKYEEDDDESCA